MEGRVTTNFFAYEECGHTDEAKKEVISIFDGKAPFDTPKPTRLLKRILQIASESNSLILDFFAGSGTTMHATMQLNAEDGGHRQSILVTNNENNICEQVTYERNKRVIQGYTTPKGEQVTGLVNNNLRYYKADFIPREPSSKYKRELVKAATDLLCIKENMYHEAKMVCNGKALRKDYTRRFTEDSKEMIVIYEPAVIKYIVDELKTWGKKEFIKVYVFSEGRYAYDDDFKEVLDKVTLCALPDAIYQAYRRVLPRRKKALPTAIDLNEDEQAEALADAAQYSYKEEKGSES
jgi:adenine-specific DNA-methyltransferase